jgi:hypothetical protein
VWREMNPQIIRNNGGFQDLPPYWNVNFATYNECEKLRMKEATNESTSLILSLNLGSEEMLLYM